MYFFLPLDFIFFLSRALLEGERVGLQDAQRRMNQHQRERVIGTFLKYVIIVACGILVELAEKISMNLIFAHQSILCFC